MRRGTLPLSVTALEGSRAESGGPRAAAVPSHRLMEKLLGGATSAAMATAVSVLGEPSSRAAALRGPCVRSFMRIGLEAGMEDRPLSPGERDDLARMGRCLAAGDFGQPSPVAVQAVLLAGYGEALLGCGDAEEGQDLARGLSLGVKHLDRLAGAMARHIADGHLTSTRYAPPGAAPEHALRELLTESATGLRDFYLRQAASGIDLDRLFPVTLVVTCGEVRAPGGGRLGPVDGPKALVLPTLQGSPTHTLLLCPQRHIMTFTAWLRRAVPGPSVVTRGAADLDEAQQRYAGVRKALPLIPAAAGREQVIDARELLSHRLLSSLSVEVVADYLQEVLGPIFGLPGPSREALLDTLGALHDTGSVRRAAKALRVHEKTVRYRIGRVQALTGLNAMTKSDWARLYVAIRIFEHFRDALISPTPPP